MQRFMLAWPSFKEFGHCDVKTREQRGCVHQAVKPLISTAKANTALGRSQSLSMNIQEAFTGRTTYCFHNQAAETLLCECPQLLIDFLFCVS